MGEAQKVALALLLTTYNCCTNPPLSAPNTTSLRNKLQMIASLLTELLCTFHPIYTMRFSFSHEFFIDFLVINNLVNIYYYFSYVKTDFVMLEGVGIEGRLTMTMPIALSIEPVLFEKLVVNIHA